MLRVDGELPAENGTLVAGSGVCGKRICMPLQVERRLF
jgi:hypothetical protein